MDNSQSENQCNIIDNSSATSSQGNAVSLKENLSLKSLTSSQTSPQSDSYDEKYDISPENSNKKSTDTSPLSDVDRFLSASRAPGQRTQSVSIDTHFENLCNKQPKMNKSISLQIIESRRPDNDEFGGDNLDTLDAQNKLKNQGLAFIIDFGDGKNVDMQRHKNMLERFQNRHRRGVSLSKLEENVVAGKARSPSSAKLPRKNLSISSSTGESSLEPEESPTKPTIRLRDKTNQIRDASKRHSWSPRSSMLEPQSYTLPSHPQPPAKPKTPQTPRSTFNPKSTVMSMALESQNKLKASDFAAIPIPCVEPPLESNKGKLEDEVSEAGTYTLDGDNYTEEQKEKMNIDKLGSTKLNRPNNFEKDLEIIDLDLEVEPQSSYTQPTSIINTRKNILEVSYCHESTNVKPKVSYLEKLKSRVKTIHRSMSRSPEPSVQELKSPDVGTFTSITTSGVLSIKPTLEINPKLKRKNSLTKSQIDSSEYVQGIRYLNLFFYCLFMWATNLIKNQNPQFLTLKD
jgi:hypothetical protein